MAGRKPKGPKALSEAEMRELEAADSTKQLKSKDLVIAKKNTVIAKLQLELQKKRVEELEAEVSKTAIETIAVTTKYEEVTKSLRAKHKVGVNWGYDPLSGEIKE